MTETSKDEAIGRAFRRQGEVEEELGLLKLEAQRMGKVFSELGGVLSHSPQNLVFDGESFSGEFHADYVLKKDDEKYVNMEKVRALANDFRRLLTEQESLAEALKRR